MSSLIGSHRTGTVSVLTGQGSAKTATGVCAPLPGAFLTDGASFKTGKKSLLTATQAPACNTVNCTPGQSILDETLPTVVTIDSGAIMAPTWGVYEIPVGSFGPCTNFQLAITMDTNAVNNVDAVVDAWFNIAGLPLEDREFGFDPGPPAVAHMTQNQVAPDLGSYHTYIFKNFSDHSTPFVNFAGPLPAMSVYIWVPVNFPDPEPGQYLVKNVHIKITTI